MGKNSKARRKGQGNYWQSAYYNTTMKSSFMSQIMNLALSRVEWVNLPPTCDARYLEYCLLTQGVATIATPKKNGKDFFSTQALVDSYPNVYDNPTSWRSFGVNGWDFAVNHDNGVLIYDNLAREPILPILDLYASELTDIMITKRLNRQHQKIPFILKGSQDQELTMLNLYKQVDGGEPAVITTSAIDDVKFEALSTGVQYLGADLQADYQNVWNMIYTVLGIPNQTFKKERQIEDEVINAARPSSMMALSPLKARQEACDKLNERFEPFIKNPIYVRWAEDVQLQ